VGEANKGNAMGGEYLYGGGGVDEKGAYAQETRKGNNI